MTPSCVGKCLGLTFPQTWKKPCLKLAKACLSTIKKFNSVIEKSINLHLDKQNEKYPCSDNSRIWKNTVKTFRQWEKLAIKMAEFKNHRRFTLRCLSKGLIPTSIKLKTKVHTPKGNEILRKAERMLMNERVRSINNTINMLNCQADTCIDLLESTLSQDVMENALNSSTEPEKEDIRKL